MSYQIIDHTADIGIKITAPTLECLFIDSALAMFDIIGYSVKGVDQKVEISLKSNSIEDLLHDFLSELLYIYETDNIAFSRIKIKKLLKNSLSVTVYGEIVEQEQAKTEIKAVTYHRLKIEKNEDKYSVEIIFDI